MVQLLLAVIYLAFISLGLPDSLLGAAWPSMYQGLEVPVSYAGILSMIISAGTILSSLQSDRLTRKLGAGKVTAISVALTAAALYGFSVSHSFWILCLVAIPYGLGAGSVDAALNNYVAIHYASRHMSWLHCMWGIGASIGPYIMGYALINNTWTTGYRIISILQIGLTIILILSLPLWKKQGSDVANPVNATKTLSLWSIFQLPGARQVMVTFFCYCALETTTGLWAASYLVMHHGINAETAASYASLFYVGITVGRAINGFLSMKLNSQQMVRLGQGIIFIGILLTIFSFAQAIALVGLVIIGLGCAPIYPSMIHATPQYFGKEQSQAVMGVQMASAYVGTCLMPPLFGFISKLLGIALFPLFLFVNLALMVLMHENLLVILKRKN